MNRWKRILLGLTLFLTISAAVVYGVYHYTLNRYASQLNDVLGAIAQDPPADDPVPAAPIAQTDPQPAPEPVAQPPAAQPAPAARSQPTKPVATQSATTQEPQAPQDTTNSTTSPELAMANQATANLDLSTQEKADVSLAVDVLGKMTIQDKLFFFQIVSKFTPTELLEFYRLYKQGDIEQIKETLSSHFTSADLERIKEIAEKYQPTEPSPPKQP